MESPEESTEGQPRLGVGLLAFAEPPKPAAPPVDNTSPLSIRKPTAPRVQPAPAARTEGAIAVPPVKFPPTDAADPDAAWDEFFAANHPPAVAVGRHMLRLLDEGKHRQIIAALKAALINGQAQPWMYQALASSMEIEKYPKAEIERVLLSMTDFGQADFGSMMLSAAYLVRFDRLDTALSMYRQASRLDPERPEPYILSLEHANKIKTPEDIIWAACGVLRHDWTQDRAVDVRLAQNTLALLERELTKTGNKDAVAQLRTMVADARAIDVQIEVKWTGAGDIDLEVEEPSGAICSVSQPQTGGGGYHLGDGYGPRAEDCHETYVCPSGYAGDYRVRLKHSFGTIVGQRATLTITLHKGTPAEVVETRTIAFENSQGSTTVTLDRGRRQQPRIVEELRRVREPVVLNKPARSIRRDPNVIPAGGQGGGVGGFLGAVGVQPNVQVIREGATLGAHALVSPDRRYVRLGISPTFANITDVFTFSFFGPPGTTGGNAAPPNR